MEVLTADISTQQAYRLLVGSIVPRPIAWVSTIALGGTPNLAPFSYFTGVCEDPPTLVISVNARQSGPKDTLRNIQDTGEFVVNIATEQLLDALVLTSGEYPPEVDEFEVGRLTPAPSRIVRAVRIAEAPIAMECRLAQVISAGKPPHETALVVGEVLAWHIQDAVLTDGRPDMEKLRPIGRLAGSEYTFLGERRVVHRPDLERAGAAH